MIAVNCCIPGGNFIPTWDKNRFMTTYECLTLGYPYLRSLGFDGVETAVARIMALDEADMARLQKEVQEGRFVLHACNGFIPAELPIVTDDAGKKTVYAYAETAIRRLSALQVPYVVFGSGTARRIPENVPYERGVSDIHDFLVHCNTVCADCGVTVVIEPLNQKETNWCYTVSEGAKLVRTWNLPHIRLLADGFHMACEGETTSVLTENRDILLHTHLANYPERSYPGNGDGIWETAFLKTLSAIHYQGAVTVECGFSNFAEEAPRAAAFMHDILAGAVQ